MKTKLNSIVFLLHQILFTFIPLNFSLFRPIEIFGRSCLSSVETVLSGDCDQVYRAENHNFFVMVLIQIFVIFFQAASFGSQWS